MVAPCFGWKRRAAIGGDKGPEGGSGPHKGAALTVAFVAIGPLAVNKSSHRHALHSLTGEKRHAPALDLGNDPIFDRTDLVDLASDGVADDQRSRGFKAKANAARSSGEN
jgi:hypothetical protein